jgi:hypothetical protein
VSLDLRARVAQVFAPDGDGQSPALFGGSILSSPGEARPERWPARWTELDCAPLTSADWNTLSGQGLRRYLPALLTAALDGDIGCRITAAHLLTDGLTDFHRELEVRWQGVGGSWVDMRARFLGGFTAPEADVVVTFLLACRDQPLTMDDERRRIEEALANFWLRQARRDPADFWRAHGRLPAPEPFDRAILAELPPIPDVDTLRRRIEQVFTAPHPGDEQVRSSDLGCEPEEVAALFAGKHDWRALEPAFLDQAGLGFLSPAAFRFYLPAFLLADLAGALMTQTPSFYLSHGLDNLGRVSRVNPLHYGELTWFDHAAERFAVFTTAEAGAIADYLRWRAADEVGDKALLQAAANFWLPKADAG